MFFEQYFSLTLPSAFSIFLLLTVFTSSEEILYTVSKRELIMKSCGVYLETNLDNEKVTSDSLLFVSD